MQRRYMAIAVRSLVTEANARILDPVYGSHGVITALQQQVENLTKELEQVRETCGQLQRAAMHRSLEQSEHSQNVAVDGPGLKGCPQTVDDKLLKVSVGLPSLAKVIPPHQSERLQEGSGTMSNGMSTGVPMLISNHKLTVTTPDNTVLSPTGVSTPVVKESTKDWCTRVFHRTRSSEN
jgi:hypothetical protein